ncbi:MAG: Tad domain-containing protein [Pseudomonadota bacterium]
MSLSKFLSDSSGHVLTILAFSLIPICGVVGACIDLQTRSERAWKAQAALDAAVLAGAKALQTGATDAEVRTIVAHYLSRHLDASPGLNCAVPAVTLPAGDDSSIEAELECTQATSLMHLLGHSTLPVNVESTSTYSLTAIDIAFMFDVSGSMNHGNRLDDLKSAATEALDVLLPSSAPATVVENTRIAIASYSNVLNAGPYFKQVTGLDPTRTYSDTVAIEIDNSEIARGRRYPEIRIHLYEADSGDQIAEIGDGAVVKVDPHQLDSVTIVVEPKPGHVHFHDYESFEFQLTGTETANASESVEPYTLYGDSGIASLSGEQWSSGIYELVLRGYDGNGLTGTRLFNKSIEFEIFKDGDLREYDQDYTLNSTCVFERDGAEKFTDAPPGTGNYLAAHSAWYHQYSPDSPAGYWKVGFNENGEFEYTGSGCSEPTPVELTNNRSALDTYISTLRAGGGTAGHLGVAWAWYLISDRWSSVFDGTATPAAFTDPEIKKAVILMTDGEFNTTGHQHQGDSQTQARALCTGMKAKGITVYAVAFKAPLAGQNVLKDCATDTDTFFNATSRQELKDAYNEIAVALSELRLSR